MVSLVLYQNPFPSQATAGIETTALFLALFAFPKTSVFGMWLCAGN
jgi:hypothetical protein